MGDEEAYEPTADARRHLPDTWGDRVGRRWHVVEEAAVLVVGDKKERLLEHLGVGPERLVDRGDQGLPTLEVIDATLRSEVVSGVLAAGRRAVVGGLDEG